MLVYQRVGLGVWEDDDLRKWLGASNLRSKISGVQGASRTDILWPPSLVQKHVRGHGPSPKRCILTIYKQPAMEPIAPKHVITCSQQQICICYFCYQVKKSSACASRLPSFAVFYLVPVDQHVSMWGPICFHRSYPLVMTNIAMV